EVTRLAIVAKGEGHLNRALRDNRLRLETRGGMAKVTKTQRLDSLTMRLFAPGMSLLHRAGLGGLASTLKAMEQGYRSGQLRDEKLPAPFENDRPPWEIDEQTVTLRFGKPEHAGTYLKKLFGYAF